MKWLDFGSTGDFKIKMIPPKLGVAPTYFTGAHANRASTQCTQNSSCPCCNWAPAAQQQAISRLHRRNGKSSLGSIVVYGTLTKSGIDTLVRQAVAVKGGKFVSFDFESTSLTPQWLDEFSPLPCQDVVKEAYDSPARYAHMMGPREERAPLQLIMDSVDGKLPRKGKLRGAQKWREKQTWQERAMGGRR